MLKMLVSICTSSSISEKLAPPIAAAQYEFIGKIFHRLSRAMWIAADNKSS